MASTERRRTRQRSDVHDRTAALSQHSFTRFLAHAKSADNEVIKNMLQLFDRQLLGLCEYTISCDIAEEIDTSKLAIDHIKQFPDRGRVRHIGLATHRADTVLASFLRRLLGTREIAIDQYKVRACLR
jgi:hypothetical protein